MERFRPEWGVGETGSASQMRKRQGPASTSRPAQLVVALTLYESEVAKGYLTQYNDDAGGALSEEAVGRTET